MTSGVSKIANAIAWITEQLLNNPEIDTARKLELIEAVSLKFDLSPKDGEYLHDYLKVDMMRPEEIRLTRKTIQEEIRELGAKIIEKRTALFELMKKCKHPDERTDQDSNLYCPDCGHFD